jgi:hypothetical protein
MAASLPIALTRSSLCPQVAKLVRTKAVPPLHPLMRVSSHGDICLQGNVPRLL